MCIVVRNVGEFGLSIVVVNGPVMFDAYSPRTMMILGAALSGGDAMSLARRLVEGGSTVDDGLTADTGLPQGSVGDGPHQAQELRNDD